MIDCENEVFTRIATMLRSEFPGINVVSEYVNAPAAFPHVSITMSDNTVVASRLDTSGAENMARVMFEINVYSNKTEGRKTECKAIANAIDKLLFFMNFRRLAYTPVPNMEDATIYRITSRYQTVTDGKYFYRR